MQPYILSAFAHMSYSRSKSRVHKVLEAVGRTIVLTSVLAGCGGGGSAGATAPTVPAAPATPSKPGSAVPSIQLGNWVVMGSSTAAGVGAPTGKGWVAMLQTEWASKKYVVVNIAKGGATTYHGISSTATPVSNRPMPDNAANIDQALARKPVLLIVSYPTNDTASGYAVDETVNNLLSIRAKALAASVPVVIVSTQPRALPASQLIQLRDIDQRLVNEVGACFVAVRAKLAGPDDKLAFIYDSGDAVHPNQAGHAVIATAVSDVLRNDACVHLLP